MKSILNNYFILSCLVGFLGAVRFRCDYSYNNLGWFKYHVVPATWGDARVRCHAEGAILASPTSTEIKSVMVNAIRHEDIFTGIHAISSGSYRSVDGIPLDVISHTWATDEPDNKNNAERCISLNSEGNFSDVSCETPRSFMCYRSNSLKDVNVCGTTDPEYRYFKKLNKCYKFHTNPRTYEQADFVCSAEGGHLAIINSDAESKAIYDIFPKKPAEKIIGSSRTDVAYVGFTHSNGEWITIHGQTLRQAGFDKFFPGEPNNSTVGEYCGSVYRNGFLNDLWCDKPFAFICEKQTNYPPVCDSNEFREDSTRRPK